VDDPFQMDHPDLKEHVLPGWNVVTNGPVSADPGLAHSTLAAGLAAGVINNSLGIAGAANCSILPITITGFISDMAAAIMWAADHGVRIVNLSWDGAYSSTINRAAEYHREKTRGMVVMAGINDVKRLPYPNQPYIYAIAMTDSSDAQLSSHGPHIDFAAPGWDLFSTTVNSSYESDSGTSYSAPLFCGVAALLMSINPSLDASEIEEILRITALDLGEPGPDEYYGFGRIDFGKAALEAYRRVRINNPRLEFGRFAMEVPLQPGATYNLLRSLHLGSANWQAVANTILTTNDQTLLVVDPSPAPGFYQMQVTLPALQ
jgi:thermitase